MPKAVVKPCSRSNHHGLSQTHSRLARREVYHRRLQYEVLEDRRLLSISPPIDLGTLGGNASCTYGINDLGQVVGDADVGSATHAFLYSNGTMTDLLGTLGGNLSRAYGINDSGQVVGESLTPSGYYRAFRYSNGTMGDLGTLGGNWSIAYAINELGEVVGQSEFVPLSSNEARHAFLFGNNGMTDLGTLSMGTIEGRNLPSLASAINDSGQVAGWSMIPNYNYYKETQHAFISSGGGLTDLGTLLGVDSYECSWAYGINNHGEVVGLSDMLGGQHAFLRTGGSLVDLGVLGDGNASCAYGINDFGQVVGRIYPISGSPVNGMSLRFYLQQWHDDRP